MQASALVAPALSKRRAMSSFKTHLLDSVPVDPVPRLPVGRESVGIHTRASGGMRLSARERHGSGLPLPVLALVDAVAMQLVVERLARNAECLERALDVAAGSRQRFTDQRTLISLDPLR